MIDPRKASMNGTEIWLGVVGHEDRYEVSNLGRVRSRKQVLKPNVGRQGYRRVSFWNPERKRMDSLQVHALVLAAFDGPCPEGHLLRHLNGVAGHDELHNLRWGTALENSHDALAHGTHRPPPVHDQEGELNHSAKLLEADVLFIRGSSDSAKALAARFGVTQWTIFDIRKGRSWAHLAHARSLDKPSNVPVA